MWGPGTSYGPPVRQLRNVLVMYSQEKLTWCDGGITYRNVAQFVTLSNYAIMSSYTCYILESADESIHCVLLNNE